MVCDKLHGSLRQEWERRSNPRPRLHFMADVRRRVSDGKGDERGEDDDVNKGMLNKLSSSSLSSDGGGAPPMLPCLVVGRATPMAGGNIYVDVFEPC